MNYEQKYKEALEKARQFSEHPLQEDSSSIVEYIFSELKESEDEKIRKTLIRFFKDSYPDETEMYDGTVTVGKALAWLEKQGEQKEYTFKSITRLLEMIEPSDRAKAYCQKLIDTFAKKGYNTDAKIVEDVLKGWNGEDVPMAVMDEQKPINDTDEEIVKAVKDTSILDMVESKFKPKFKIGDVVKMDYCLGKVVEITNDAYLLDTGQGIPFSNEYKMELLKKIEPNNPCARIYCADFNGGEGYYKLSLDNLNKKQVEAIEALVASWNKKV